jgi:hypothetical protein
MERLSSEMRTPDSASRFVFWWRWLLVVTAGVVLFGALLLLAPGLTRQLFSLLLYGAQGRLDTFPAEALAYVTLTHGVLGAVMFGWGLALLMLLSGPFRRRSDEAWRMLVVSLLAWFIPDTLYSLWSGFWQNAALNLGFALLYSPALIATKGLMRDGRA